MHCCRTMYIICGYILYLYVVPTVKATTFTGNATWYDLGSDLTACGQTHSNQEMVAAVSSQWWGSNADHDTNVNHDPMCNKTINVADATNTTFWLPVMIVDKCGACGLGDLDLSPGTFQQFHELGLGRFPIIWEFAEANS